MARILDLKPRVFSGPDPFGSPWGRIMVTRMVEAFKAYDAEQERRSKMQPMSSREYQADHVERAAQSLKDHALIRHDEWKAGGGIVIVGKANGSSHMRCEIVLTPSGHLTLTGDLDTMCWGRYHDKTVAGAIGWMARTNCDGYVQEKAGIGMGGVGVQDFVPEVALWEAHDYIKHAAADKQEDEVQMWRETIERLECLDIDLPAIREAIYDFDGDGERVAAFGMVPSSRLLWAWSIVCKADDLLYSQHFEVPL